MKTTAKMELSGFGSNGPANDIAGNLEHARAQIEQRFLEGGTLLVSVLDVFTQLTQTLEKVTGALKEEEAKEATSELKLTAGLIASLPEAQALRDRRLEAIGAEGCALSGHIADMEETLRYLRTFATTAKITGANIPDFAGFAVEIIERIQFATREVASLSSQIGELHGMIALASKAGGEKMQQHADGIPAIVADLSANAEAIEVQRAALAKVATKIGDMAQKVQGRLASSLSSLQIGDVTRQRIEHCQTAFSIAQSHMAAEQVPLSNDERNVLMGSVETLVHEQLKELAGDFGRECSKIVSNIQAFFADAASLVELHETMLPQRTQNEASPLRAVQSGLENARRAVGEVEKSATEAIQLSQSASRIVDALVQRIETIQLVRTDIQYMALNTNLRCGRLGEEGRAINVVTSELRTFSGKLDETGELTLGHLHKLNQMASEMRDSGGEGSDDLANHIDIALVHVMKAADSLETQMSALRESGQNVANCIANAESGLNFHQSIQDIIADCAESTSSAKAAHTEMTGREALISAISTDIYKTYTMKSERDVHSRIFSQVTEAPAETVAAKDETDDEDLFDDALF
ncbi:hypothetical protein [Rhizobium sp. L1K21]|uniref:hypothetical protein n=1 Tax=Rhizobium sp. L1K21 TaxID=2954933 RepID=UPI002092FC38|nr:hypothetical protein [Rhizobium sp. L1K21]MCO6188602.1 hypothetical protein [Rhizobium sp. L1K21]